MADVAKIRRYLDKRLSSLRTDRLSWWQTWYDISRFIVPRRGKFLTSPNQSDRGKDKNTSILDGTARLALRTLASGMTAGITSPARPWFRLTLGNDEIADQSENKLWLSECQRRIFRVMSQSNLYNSLHVAYEEIGLFGTGIMLVEDDPKTVIHCHTLTSGEYMLALDGKFRPNVLFREFVMTVDQVVGRFGLNAISPSVQSLYESDQLEREIIVAHAIEPVDDKFTHPMLKNRAFRSIYWELGQQNDLLLEVKGYHEKPFCAFRWNVIGNEAYGCGPGEDSLGDVKSLQKMQLRIHQAIDKKVHPPLIADPSMKTETANLLPGGITYVSTQSGVGFKPVYEVPLQVQELEMKIKETQERINQTFYKDLWLMISQLDTVRTATEIAVRKEEKMLMLGPVLERLQNELLNPLIDRIFGIMLRNALIPPPPQSIQGFNLDVQYVSTLADAQKAVDTTGVERLVGFIGNLAAARPDALDTLSVDAAIDDYADMLGVSPHILNTSDQVAAIRKQRADQAAQQQSIQNNLAAAQGAKTLSAVDVGGGQNAIQKMIGA